MVQAAVAIGGNLGDVPATISQACAELTRHRTVSAWHRSSLFRSAPMGAAAGEPFWNAACIFHTSLAPHALLAELQRIENSAGRRRGVHWGPRTLDLDLILYGSQTVTSDTLTVPHPHFWYRRFVLEPLAELIPETVPPGFSLSVQSLADRLRTRPLRLGIGGTFDEAIARQVVADFAEQTDDSPVHLTVLPAPTGRDPRKPSSELDCLGLLVWFDNADEPAASARCVPALRCGVPVLRCGPFESQTLRNVLAAAAGQLERV